MDPSVMDVHVSAAVGGSSPAAPEVPWNEILALAPHLLWAVVLVGILAWIGRDLLTAILRNVRKVSIAGVEIEIGEDIKAAGEHRGHPVDDPTASRLARRLARCGTVMEGAKILWIDDHPRSHDLETELIERLGALVILAASNERAAAELARMRYDLVISDIGRDAPEAATAGLQSVAMAAGAPGHPPVIFYVTAVTQGHHGGFGLTNRPDELLHLILDALSRRRG